MSTPKQLFNWSSTLVTWTTDCQTPSVFGSRTLCQTNLRGLDWVITHPSLRAGFPHGCLLSPLLYTHNCAPKHNSNTIVRFADDTKEDKLISVEDESGNREKVRRLIGWCSDNNLHLNTTKIRSLWTSGVRGCGEGLGILFPGCAQHRRFDLRSQHS